MKNNRKISGLSDSELVSLYSESRAHEYYAEFFLRYVPSLYGVALKYGGGDRAQAKSTVRALYEGLPEKFAAAPAEDPRRWLYGEIMAFVGSTGEDDAGDAVRESVSRLEQGDEEIWKVLEGGSKTITKPQTVCLKMFFAQKKSFAEIADTSGYLSDSIRAHITKGLDALCTMISTKKSAL